MAADPVARWVRDHDLVISEEDEIPLPWAEDFDAADEDDLEDEAEDVTGISDEEIEAHLEVGLAPHGMALPTHHVHQGDVMDVLPTLEPASVSCVVTSPPYWGLRDYGIPGRTWEDGWVGCLGLEPTLDLYIEHLVEVFKEVKRVLHPRGSLWLNLGDCYAGGGRHVEPVKYGPADASKPTRQKSKGMSGQNLLMVPARAALALQQSRVVSKIKREEDKAWLAALVDGEGTISIRKFVSNNRVCQDGFVGFLTVSNNDHALLERCVKITGYGNIRVKNVAGYVSSGGIRNRHDNFNWRLEANAAIEIIRDIYPYLITKKRQAALVHTLDLSNKRGRSLRGNQALPASEQERRVILKQLVNACNQREVVDIPAWCEEPAPNVELGWILRQDQIWAKGVSFCKTYSGSVMPESVRTRTTCAHEHIFHFTQSEKAFYDIDGCREPYAESTLRSASAGYRGRGRKDYAGAGVQDPSSTKRRVLASVDQGAGRNLRSVWVIPKESFPGAHFATFGLGLVKPIIQLATSERGVCDVCMAPIERRRVKEPVPADIQAKFEAARLATTGDTGRKDGHTQRKPNFRRKVLRDEWERSCACQSGTKPAVVMDPFSGSGRAGIAATQLGRSYLGIELNSDYVRMSEDGLAAAISKQETKETR